MYATTCATSFIGCPPLATTGPSRTLHGRGYSIRTPALAQSGGVLCARLDLRLGHFRPRVAHHAVRIVGARAGPEGLQLRFDVLRILTADARILARNAGTVRAVAARARGHARRPICPPGGVLAPPPPPAMRALSRSAFLPAAGLKFASCLCRYSGN